VYSVRCCGLICLYLILLPSTLASQVLSESDSNTMPNIAEKVTKAGGIALRRGQKPAQSLTAGDGSEFVYSTLCLSYLL
jgi:hypothetical protein